MRQAAAMAAVAALALSASADSLYLQGTSDFGFGFASSDSTDTANFLDGVTADNFTLSDTGRIDSVGWWGQNPADVVGFTVTFYDSNAGSVGAVIHSESVAPSSAPHGVNGFYEFDATLASPLVLTGGTEYFVSIVASMSDPATQAWAWEITTNGPDDDVQFSTGSGFAPLGLAGSGFGNAAFELVGFFDGDSDGLFDDEEDALGTDPGNADSDGDGLLDGAELEIMCGPDGTSSPDPLNPDSDGDTLSDGFEVNINGSDPCNPDTDDDGLTDDVDPNPTVPDVTPEYLEDFARDLCDRIANLPLSEFNGFNNWWRKAQRTSLAVRACLAANFIACGHYDFAAVILATVYLQMDGEDCPHDWVNGSETTDDIAADIAALIELLLL